MEEYSMAEVRLFYEKIICEEMNDQANFIEGVVAGISGAFGGYDELKPMLKQMRLND